MPEPKRCSCCEKHTLRAQEEKKKLLNRLRRIEGQVRGLQAMVEADAYCNDVPTTTRAMMPKPSTPSTASFWPSICAHA